MNWLIALELIGAAQGAFLAALLVGREHNSLPNRLLAFVMLAFSMELLSAVYHELGLDLVYPQFIGLTFPLPFLYTPGFYLYAETLASGRKTLNRRQLLHLGPFVVAVLVMLPFYFEPATEKIVLLENPQVGQWSGLLFSLNHLKYPYSLAYILAILVVIRRHRIIVKETLSYLDRVNLNWIRNVTIGGIIVWLVALTSYLIGLYGNGDGKTADPIEGLDDYVMLASAIFVYAIGFMGLRQAEIFTPGRAAVSGGELHATRSAGSEVLEDDEAARYSKSGFSLSEASELETRLLDLMTSQKPYRNSTLTLPDLAAMLDTTTHRLSQTLNAQIKMNFYDFVNTYRIDEVKSRLADPSNRNLTILSIGLDAGFNSKSAFNSVFKKQTGMSPSEYRGTFDRN